MACIILCNSTLNHGWALLIATSDVSRTVGPASLNRKECVNLNLTKSKQGAGQGCILLLSKLLDIV